MRKSCRTLRSNNTCNNAPHQQRENEQHATFAGVPRQGNAAGVLLTPSFWPDIFATNSFATTLHLDMTVGVVGNKHAAWLRAPAGVRGGASLRGWPSGTTLQRKVAGLSLFVSLPMDVSSLLSSYLTNWGFRPSYLRRLPPDQMTGTTDRQTDRSIGRKRFRSPGHRGHSHRGHWGRGSGRCSQHRCLPPAASVERQPDSRTGRSGAWGQQATSGL